LRLIFFVLIEKPTVLTQEMLEEGMVLLFNKPLDWTSFDVVNKVGYMMKNHYKKRIKVGHAGTLDPRATGLLILCTGKATKRIIEFQDMDKVYTGSFVVGKTTPSFDTETEPDATYPTEGVNLEVIKATAQTFLGATMQYPPAYSAVKIKGERAYDIARRGEVPVIQAKEVNVRNFDVLEISHPRYEFEITCTKGTYIRSLVNDLGSKIGCGAYLETLHRSSIGTFSAIDALELDYFKDILS
jgi:tRNA pseudouridine55 synthase